MQAEFKRRINIVEQISGTELADLFWGMSADHQAKFFNRLGEHKLLAAQLQYTSDTTTLEQSGRTAMSLIGEYAGCEWAHTPEDDACDLQQS